MKRNVRILLCLTLVVCALFSSCSFKNKIDRTSETSVPMSETTTADANKDIDVNTPKLNGTIKLCHDVYSNEIETNEYGEEYYPFIRTDEFELATNEQQFIHKVIDTNRTCGYGDGDSHPLYFVVTYDDQIDENGDIVQKHYAYNYSYLIGDDRIFLFSYKERIQMRNIINNYIDVFGREGAQFGYYDKDNGLRDLGVNVFYSETAYNMEKADELGHTIDEFYSVPAVGDIVVLSTEGKIYHKKAEICSKIIDITDDGKIVIETGSYHPDDYLLEYPDNTRNFFNIYLDDVYTDRTFTTDDIVGIIISKREDFAVIKAMDDENITFELNTKDKESKFNGFVITEKVSTVFKDLGLYDETYSDRIIHEGSEVTISYYVDQAGNFISVNRYWWA